MADSSRYLIKPRPPVRAFFIAAVASVAGAALLVLALTQGWHWVVAVVGGVLIAVGVALAVLAFLAPERQKVQLTFTPDGYRLEGQGSSESGLWEDVTRVTQSVDGRRVTIFSGEEARHHLMFAPGSDVDIELVLQDLSVRLDAAKGYRNF